MTLNKRRAVAQLEQARLHLERGEWAQVEALVTPVREQGFSDDVTSSLLGEALRRLGRLEEARKVLVEGHAAHPQSAEIEARLGCVLLDLDEPSKAVEHFLHARQRLGRDPQLLTSLAAALLRLGRAEEAEAQLARALLLGAGPDARLVLAGVKARRGQLGEADRLAAKVEDGADPGLRWAARALRTDLRFLKGDARGALDAWLELEREGQLQSWQDAHLALAAEVCGESALSERVMARRIGAATADDLVLFAQIANLRRQPERALEWLSEAEKRTGQSEVDWLFEARSTRGRALRLLGRHEEARVALEEACAQPEANVPRLGVPPHVDLGLLALDQSAFDVAERHLRRALELDPDAPEARHGLELVERRLGWRQAFEASAEERLSTARAETEAMRRRFVMRETEVERLKRELAELKDARREAERDAAQVLAQAQAERERLEREKREALRRELEQRERDVEAKALENLQSVFGVGREACPEKLWQMLRVAERTYQQALYTELPAAAVAVLFSGAFERSLVDVLAQEFSRWLDAKGLRARFLDEGVRERRGSRVEYSDRFFDWFDREQDARPPSLGEIARVLERRGDLHLALWRRFLTEFFSVDDAFWSEFSKFVTWGKETLRDPVAHGHIEIDWDGLKQFREKLLFQFAGASPGALPRLLAARKK